MIDWMTEEQRQEWAVLCHLSAMPTEDFQRLQADSERFRNTYAKMDELEDEAIRRYPDASPPDRTVRRLWWIWEKLVAAYDRELALAVFRARQGVYGSTLRPRVFRNEPTNYYICGDCYYACNSCTCRCVQQGASLPSTPPTAH